MEDINHLSPVKLTIHSTERQILLTKLLVKCSIKTCKHIKYQPQKNKGISKINEMPANMWSQTDHALVHAAEHLRQFNLRQNTRTTCSTDADRPLHAKGNLLHSFSRLINVLKHLPLQQLTSMASELCSCHHEF